MRRNRLWQACLVLVLLAGCDSNPNGPSAPSVPPDASGTEPKPGGVAPKQVPLKQVGAPIGLIVVPTLGG